MPSCDVAIIGAGPYGLSAAAHLNSSRELDVRVFGEPMAFWEKHMPRGMLLRSPWAGSHISDPAGALTLHAYQSVCGRHISSPLPLSSFVDYGRWFQTQVAPDLERAKVSRLERRGTQFRLHLENGKSWDTPRVIVASGVGSFAYIPAKFRGLSPALVSHTSEHSDLARFSGRRVVVIGAGQSALESSALLHENGAEVEIVARSQSVDWLWRKPYLHRWPLAPILYASSDVGPAFISHLVARPSYFRQLPIAVQNRFSARSIRPAAAPWLKPRCEHFPIRTNCLVVSASPKGGYLQLTLNDGSRCCVDHLLLATGYRVDISRYSFLSRELVDSIRQIQGYPLLDSGFESSVPGLHFLGAPAARSFGPLMRFVAGTSFASSALARKLARSVAGQEFAIRSFSGGVIGKAAAPSS